MFGENVPKDVVDRATAVVESSDGILTAGTSLMVHSIYRFVRHAHELHIPIAIVNIGPTRADDLAMLKVGALTGAIFSQLASTVTASSSSSSSETVGGRQASGAGTTRASS